MEQPIPIEERNSFLRNDRKLVCSMFVIYGLCICGLIGATVWGLYRRERTVSANATSTAAVFATEQAKGAATAIARRAEQAKYQMTDRFDNNRKGWYVGSEDDEYWSGYVAIQDGVYIWNAKNVKQGFTYWSDFPSSGQFHDFDVYVDTKLAKDSSGYVCSGIVFRLSLEEDDYYYYSLCNDSFADISYYTGEDWENIASVPYPSYEEWSRLEVSARGSHFIFLINGNIVYEMEDDRQKTGRVALTIGVSEGSSARIYFDNFGFQPR